MSHPTPQLLWEQYLKDPSQLRDNSNGNLSTISGQVKHPYGQVNYLLTRPAVDEDTSSLLERLKSCGKEKDLLTTRRTHADICGKDWIIKDIYVATTLLRAYAKCGALKEAREVFNQLHHRNVVSWNALIAGYTENKLAGEALRCFRQMQEEGVSPDAITYICCIKACTIIGSVQIGEEIYARVNGPGLLSKDAKLGSALVNMYAKCGAPVKACEVFNHLPLRNVSCWTALIAGYVEDGLGNEALKCFVQMEDEGVSPDAMTYTCILKACAIVGALEMGEEIHARLRKQRLLGRNLMLGTALVNMYAKCGALREARQVFDQLQCRDVVSWTALIVGYVESGLGDEALKCFMQMEDEGCYPDIVSYVSTLKACAIVGSLEIGKEIHRRVRMQRLLGNHTILGTALVDMYAKCDAMRDAQDVFNQLHDRDVVSWTALIAGYVEHGYGDEALKCFLDMQYEGVSPNTATYICVLKACSIAGSLGIGKQLHYKLREQGLLDKDVMIGNTLIDFYAKCGALREAHEVFDYLPRQDIVSWNALLAGYARIGKVDVILVSFRRMRMDGVLPDLVTFLVLLNACSHAAFLEEGQNLFNEMIIVYGLNPTVEHYTCMVDLHGRAGLFDKAKLYLVNEVRPFLAFMGACRKWLHVDFGRWAFEKLITQMDEKCTPAYICMANIYADAGMQTKAQEIEAFRIKHKAWKNLRPYT